MPSLGPVICTSFIRTSSAAVVAAGILLGGCADNIPKAEIDPGVVSAYRIDADDQLTIKVTMAPGVYATEDQKEHFRNLVTDKLNARRAQNAANGDSRKCEVDITFTRFEQGSTFARAMLADLGQIHLDANIVVVPTRGGGKLDVFRVSKTFAWGGLYGASENIEDIELPFADSIAAVLTGQPPEPDKTIVAGDVPKS
jgi:hypothetical protein